MNGKKELIVLPVEDVDRAKAFYIDACGFDPTPDRRREGGLGLVAVARVARAWGIRGGDHTTVWCDLPLDAATEL